jgi:c-di-GMP-binding flagellar brake protein YcgR
MTKTSKTKRTASKKTKKKKKSMPDITVDRRREWRFELPLSAIVEGELPTGKKFKEDVTLENISSGGAYFCLDSGVVVGSKLNLVIDVPTELSEGKKIKLSLGGLTIRLEKPDKKEKKQGVALRFRKKFEFVSE